MTRTPAKTIACLAAFLSVTAVAAATARAQDEAAKEAARAKLKEGAGLLETGDYARALADFEEAYRLVPNPKILFNIGLAQMGLGHPAAAMRVLDRFVAEAKNASATNIIDAQKQIESLRPKVAVIEIKSDEAGIDITIDGHAEGKTPLASRVYLDPGEHQLAARRDDATPPTTQAFTVSAGEQRAVTVALPVAVAAPPPAPVPAAVPAATTVIAAAPTAADTGAGRPVYRKPWFWGIVGASVLAVGLTVFLVAGRSTTYPNNTLGSISGD